MKKNLAITILFLGLITCLLSITYAQTREVKTVRSLAVVLKRSHPAISKALIQFANKEEREIYQGEEKEVEANIKLLRTAASLLEKSHPNLSSESIKYAREDEKELMEERKSDDSEMKEENEE